MFNTPRKAATIAVIRDSDESPSKLEVLLMKRGKTDKFLPLYYVFPGGAVDEQDYSDIAGYSPSIYPNVTGDERNSLFVHLNAAIRETFEESGILLANDKSGQIPDLTDPQVHLRFHEYRERIFRREMDFLDMLNAEKLEPAYERLYYISRHITPVFLPIRYDARFFVAICPGNQHVLHDGDELVETACLSPEEALAMHKRGRMKMVQPTVETLKLLSRFNSISHAMEYFAGKESSSPLSGF